MTVLARPKSSDKSLSPRRARRASLAGVSRLRSVGSGSGNVGAGAPGTAAATPAEAGSQVPQVAERVGGTAVDAQPTAHVDHAMSTLDVAMYTCECGFVFEAEVLTTVSCPHCGCGQAW